MDFTELSPLEMNRYRFSGNHSPLTPEQMMNLKDRAETVGSTDNSAPPSISR